MNLRVTITAAIIAGFISAPTLAQTLLQNSNLACARLEKQLDQALVTQGNNPKADDAQSLRTEGEKQCNTGHPKSGTQRLQEALDILEEGEKKN